MSTIQGYVDDSGDERDPQHGAMSVAGYLGSADCWAEFNTDWLKALQVFGVSHLHMRELKKRIGQFKSWSPDDEREAALLGTLANVIGKAKLKGFGAVVALPDLRRFNAETGAGIDASALALYASALSARQLHQKDCLELLLDRTTDGNRKVATAASYGKTDSYYPFMRDFPKFVVLAKDGPGGRDISGLQAADFLAWELRKNYELKRPWFESEHPSPDSPDWGKSLMGWHVQERIAHMQKHKVKELSFGVDIMRRSLSALADAAPIEGIIWDYRAISIAHEARNGVWVLPEGVNEEQQVPDSKRGPDPIALENGD